MEALLRAEPNGGIIREAILQLVQECRCPICLEFFTEPRNAPCQHNFCELCIYEHIKDHHSECPTCRHPGVNKRSLAKNNSLANITACVRRLSATFGIALSTSKTQPEALPDETKSIKNAGKRYGHRSKRSVEIRHEDPSHSISEVDPAHHSAKPLVLCTSVKEPRQCARSSKLQISEEKESQRERAQNANMSLPDGYSNPAFEDTRRMSDSRSSIGSPNEHGNTEGESLFFVDFGSSLVIPSFPSEPEFSTKSRENARSDQTPARFEGRPIPQASSSKNKRNLYCQDRNTEDIFLADNSPKETAGQIHSHPPRSTHKRKLEGHHNPDITGTAEGFGSEIDRSDAHTCQDHLRLMTRPRTGTADTGDLDTHRLSAAKTVDLKSHPISTDEHGSDRQPEDHGSSLRTSPKRSSRDTSCLPSPCRLETAFSEVLQTSNPRPKADIAQCSSKVPRLTSRQDLIPSGSTADRAGAGFSLSPTTFKQTRSQVKLPNLLADVEHTTWNRTASVLCSTDIMRICVSHGVARDACLHLACACILSHETRFK